MKILTEDFFNNLNNYIYTYYLNYLSNTIIYKNSFSTHPFFYFRNIFFKNNLFINDLEDNNNILSYIKKYDERYTFLLEEDLCIKNPEFLNDSDIKNIKSLLKENNNNFYALNAYITFYYNKGELNLTYYFKKILDIENNNPHILAKLSRYQASVLYKKHKDIKYLTLGKKNLLLAIKQFNNNNIPTFFYSWLGYIEYELGKYENSIELYNKVIKINNNLNIQVPEPYIWKMFSLNKMGIYKLSVSLGLWFLKNNELNCINNKRDFRFYKIFSDNYLNLGEYNSFYTNLRLTIKFFLREYEFHFNNNLILNLNISILKLINIIEKNKYNSFILYNKNYIKDNIDNIILSIAFLYKEKKLGNNIIFNDSRGIELLCYNYLKLIYEGKIK